MNRVLRIGLLFILCISILISLAGCSSTAKTSQSAPGKVKILTTVYPVYEFARQVGGDKVEVEMLVPPGAEPHDWDPTAQDIIKIKGAKLFLYHGAGLEPVDKLLTKEVLGSVKAVEVSRGIPVITGHDQIEGKNPHHDSEMDAHLWLDPQYAQQEVKNIAAALVEIDPQNKEYYQKNAERFEGELAQLDQEYQTALTNVKRRDIITSHAAFTYLAKRYNLQQVGIMGLAPDSEPTSARMAEIVEFCRQHQVRYIFFETLVSPKLANAIAKETGAGLLVLNPIENLTEAEMKQGKNYLSIMRENLVHLTKALNE